jgi:hypothetical protein
MLTTQRADRHHEITVREAQALLKQIASLCEDAYRRGAHQAVVMEMSPEDGSWYRYVCTDRFRGKDFHLIAHRIPEPFTPEQVKDWPKAAQKNPSRFYSKHSNQVAVQVHGLDMRHGGKAFKELDALIAFSCQ